MAKVNRVKYFTQEKLNLIDEENMKKYKKYLQSCIIKNKDVTEKEYAIISENISNLSGFNTKLDWERVYPYGDVFRSILGNVSSSSQGIPSELADYYLDNGNTLLDVLGKKEFYIPLKSHYIKRVNLQDKKIITEGGSELILWQLIF